ncbi:MAG: response regulator [Bacteroidota bacterium]
MNTTTNKILIIDDDEIDLELMRCLLTKEGYNILQTADGPQGVMLYKEHRPVLVFLDLGLPTISGLEVLKEIRHYDERAKIILITGYGSVQSAVSAMKLGALDFVEKTWDIGEMTRKIQLALEAFGEPKP